LILVTILFTGCEKQKQIEPKTVFDADFTLYYNEMQIKGELVSSDEAVEINVLSPKTLKGLKVNANGNKFDVDYNGIKVSYTKNNLPDGAFFKLILISLQKIMQTDTLVFEKVDEKYQATEEWELGDIKITLNKDFYIEKIEIPRMSFNIKLNQKNALS